MVLFLIALFTGGLQGLFAQTVFFFLKQGTLPVKGNSTAAHVLCGQPSFFKDEQVQGGNTAKYQQKYNYIHRTSAVLPGPGIERRRSIGCGPGGSCPACVQIGYALP